MQSAKMSRLPHQGLSRHLQAAASDDIERDFALDGKGMHGEPDSDSVLWDGYCIETF